MNRFNTVPMVYAIRYTDIVTNAQGTRYLCFDCYASWLGSMPSNFALDKPINAPLSQCKRCKRSTKEYYQWLKKRQKNKRK